MSAKTKRPRARQRKRALKPKKLSIHKRLARAIKSLQKIEATARLIGVERAAVDLKTMSQSYPRREGDAVLREMAKEALETLRDIGAKTIL